MNAKPDKQPDVRLERRVNWHLVIGTAAFLAVLAATLYFVHRAQVSRIAEAFKDRGLQLRQAGDLSEAAEYLFRYARYRPADAQVALAETYDESAATIAEKQRSIELHYHALGVAGEEDRPKLRRRLAVLLLESSRLSQAQEQAESLLSDDALGSGADAVGQRVLAASLYIQYKQGLIHPNYQPRQPNGASERPIGDVVRQACAANPDRADLAEMLADIYRTSPELLPLQERVSSEQRNARADAVMARFALANPDDIDARLAYFRYLVRHDLPGVEEQVQAMLKLRGDLAAVRLSIAEYQKDLAQRKDPPLSTPARQQLLSQALSHVAHIIQLAPNNEAACVMQGEIFAAQNDPRGAMRAWLAGVRQLDNDQDSVELNLRIAEMAARLNDPQAQSHVDRLDRSLENVGPRISSETIGSLFRGRDLIVAQWRIAQDRGDDALELLEPIVKLGDGLGAQSGQMARACDLIAQVHASKFRWEDAARSYEQAILLDPDEPGHRLGAGTMWQRAGSLDKAVHHWEAAAPRVNTLDAWLALARTQFQTTGAQPKEQRDWKPFEASLNAARDLSRRQHDRGPWQLALLEIDYRFISAESHEAAVAQAAADVRNLESAHPDDAELWRQLPMLYERLKLPQDADRCLARLAELSAGSVEVFIARAELLAQREEYSQAVAILEEGIRKLDDAAPAQEQDALRRAMVQVRLAQGDLDAARAVLTTTAQLQPNNPLPMYQLLDLAVKRGQFEQAVEWEAMLLKLEGKATPVLRHYRILRLLGTADQPISARLAEAELEYKELAKAVPDLPLTHYLKGRLDEQRGNFEQATTAYTAAIQAGDLRIATFERLIQVLYRQQRFAEAQEYLAKLDRLIPKSNRLSSLAISVATRLEDQSRAEQLARRGVQERPDDPSAWLWLGNVLSLAEDNDKAHKCFQKARRLAPDDLRTFSGLFGFYVRTDQSDQARQMLDELPNHADLPPAHAAMIRAQAYESLQDRDTAAQQYELASRLAPDDYKIRMQRARFYGLEHPEEAERSLNEARAIVQGAGDSQALDVVDRTLAAQKVLQRSGHRLRDLQTAQRLLEGLVGQDKPSDADRMLLALVYAELGKVQLTADDRDRFVKLAGEQFESALQASQAAANVAQLAIYVRFLLDHERPMEAQRWLDELEVKSPDTLETAALKARWLHAVERNEQIEPFVERVAVKLQKAWQDDKAREALALRVGQIYAGVERHAAAQRWYGRASASESGRYATAMTLADQGQIEQAVAICLEAAESDVTSRPAIVLCHVLLKSNGREVPTAGNALVTSALNKHQDDIALLISAANLRVAQQRHAEAVALYERVLKLKPADPLILNNLATLLGDVPATAPAALKYIEQAIEVAGPLPALLDTKGTVLLTAAQPHDAVEVLKQAATAPGADPRYRFHYAVALAQVGSAALAKQELRAALAANLTSQLLTERDRQLLEDLRTQFGLLAS